MTDFEHQVEKNICGLIEGFDTKNLFINKNKYEFEEIREILKVNSTI